MQLKDRYVLVTGAASGIGLALARRCCEEGAAGVCLADVNPDVLKVADEISAFGVVADVADEAQAARLCNEAIGKFGRIDVLFSNAGVATRGGPEVEDAEWQRLWGVNVMAHIHLVRHLVPPMVERGEGYVVGTVSAAGLVNHVGSAPYGVTKAAALSFFEWLAMAHGDDGVRISALCPLGVRTNMFLSEGGESSFLAPTAIEPEQVAQAVVDGMHAETFLILPHPEVAEFFRRKGDDYDRWLRGMRRLRKAAIATE